MSGPPSVSVPATCTAYLGASKIDVTKNVLTFDTTTTASVGWLTAKDCLTDSNAALLTEKNALVSSSFWTAL